MPAADSRCKSTSSFSVASMVTYGSGEDGILAELAIFLFAKLLSATVILGGIITGLLSRTWQHFVIGAVTTAIVGEAVLLVLRAGYSLNARVFFVAILAAAAWACLGYAVKRVLMR